MKNTTAALLSAGVLALALTGCSGEDDPGADPTKASSSDSPSIDPSKVSPSDLPPFPALKKKLGGAFGDLQLGECATEAGRQKVTGTLTSSQKKAADFLVTVSWTTDTSDVMGLGWTFLKDVAPGDSVDFTIKAKVAEGASRCVAGVDYGKA